MESIFKALGDPTRRAILDSLRRKDGQSLSDLEEQVAMTRFGLMKHLTILEDATLITTVKKGRFKYHYLNALPLQEVIDRWIDPFLQKPAAKGLLALKTHLEGRSAMTKPDFVMHTFIRCTHDALWDALTKADHMAAYHFACQSVQGDAAEGVTTDFLLPDGGKMLSQTTTRLDPKTRIEMTFHPHFMGPDAPASNCVYLIEPQGPICKLTVEHYNMAPGQEGFAEGWARLAASLKSWLETGTSLQGTAA